VLKLRRVVTSHDEEGAAIVAVDEICSNVVSSRPGHASVVVWSAGEFPVDNSGWKDGATRTVASTDPAGAIFRVVEYAPGVSPRNHRTESIDYAVVISGEIDMELDHGVVVQLTAGDVLVQRGTIHNWVNHGQVPCRIAFVLIAARPVTVAGKILGAQS
jgi:mannose-6-phosphate isomerase-like protein (cupin superfamily)